MKRKMDSRVRGNDIEDNGNDIEDNGNDRKGSGNTKEECSLFSPGYFLRKEVNIGYS